MVTMGSSAASPAVSSSSTLWATASKEWVIPAKPKPGRKPKKDVPPPVNEDDEVDSKGRRVQNRAAQRAFRERKQSQLADLQARVQLYEQGEIERNVALQNIAKRLKEENEKLRSENNILKEKVSKFESQRDSPQEAERKRSRDNSPSTFSNASDQRAKKRSKTSSEPSIAGAQHLGFPSYSPSPSMVSSPDSNGSPFSPVHLESESRHSSVFSHQVPSLANILSFQPNEKPNNYEPTEPFSTFGCGFCTEETPCVCRELAMQQVAAEQMSMSNQTSQKMEHFDPETSTPSIDTSISLTVPSAAPQISILDNLPAYQPPVPLRRKGGPSNSSLGSLFPVSVPPPQITSTAVDCTGDPSNCMACADDPFGKAFCTAICESAATMSPCSGCPNPKHNSNGGGGCCGDPSNCFCGTSSSMAGTSPPMMPSAQIIPTSDVWRALKSHPNVTFSDLSLLADVVARRSKCTGPSVVISPALGSITPERISTPSTAPEADSQPVILTDPHAHYHAKQHARSGGSSSPPRLVPQEVLMRCGRQRVREVHADAVKDALRLLDAKFARS